MRLPGLTDYLTAPELIPARAAAVLRTAFAGMFFSQTVLAGVVLGVLMLVVGGPARAGRGGGALGWTLALLALSELPLGLALTERAGRRPGRGGPLAGALLAGVVLSTPAWFTALAVATGQAALPVAALVGVLAALYGVGFLRCGALARLAAGRPPTGGHGA